MQACENTFTYDDTFSYKLIYVLSINDEKHKGLLKIGETTIASKNDPTAFPPNCDALNKAAEKRTKQYTTALIESKVCYTEIATKKVKIPTGDYVWKSFSDRDVHNVLSRSGYIRKEHKESNKKSEWFKVDLTTVINAIKAIKENRMVLYSYEKSTPPQTAGEMVEKITLRQEQQEAVNKALSVFETSDEMLWNCKMRFGKTVSAYELIKKGEFQKTIIVTHRPVVEEGWGKDHDLIFGKNSSHLFVTKESDGSTFEYDKTIDSENDRKLRYLVKQEIPFAYFASMQDLRGSKRADGKYNKNNAVFDIDWDLVICDEAHEGTQTEMGQNVIDLLKKPKNGKKPKVLLLSGTPYNILDKYDGKVYSWDYVMEQKRKKEFLENYPDMYNPYADLPEMRILTFDLQQALPTAYRYEAKDMAFNFDEFFRTWTGDSDQDFHAIPIGADVGDFVHEADVKSFLDLISMESENSNYPFSTKAYRDMFRHTFWKVPGVKAAKALSKLLNSHSVFKNYKVVNVAGDGDEEKDYDNALTEVQSAIVKNPYTITLTCGRLTTGVTVPEWSAVMMLSGSANSKAISYMQTIFRVQSVGSIDGKQKEVAYVFDFAPDRTLKVLQDVHSISSKGRTDDNIARVRLGEFLNFCPVISISGTQMTEYDVPHMMRQIKKIIVEKAIASGFEDDCIYNEDVGIKMDATDIELFRTLAAKITGKSKGKLPKDVTVNKQGLTNEEYDKAKKAKNKPKRQLTAKEKEAIRKLQEQRKEREKVLRLLRAISIRLPMLIYGAEVDIAKDIRMSTFVNIVDDESWLEFMPQGVTKDLFKKLLKYYDEDVIVAAGYRIRRLAKAADELPPTERVKRITEIFSMFRNPDKETVLTPWRVVNMHMGDIVGGYNFYKENYPTDDKVKLEKPRFIDNGDVTKNLFQNPNAKLLEMNSKSGLYPLYLAYSIYAMKLNKPENEMPMETTKKIWHETLAEGIYVLCKTKMAERITRRTLIGYENNCLANTIYIPHLIDWMETKEDRLVRKLTNPKTWQKGGDRLKFDAVVGNPPYQLTGGSGGTSDAPIYQEFAVLAEKLNPEYISLIMPSRWFSGGRENLLAEFRKNMLNNHCIRKLYVFTDSRDIFPTVEIKGGLCYYLYDKKYNGECQYNLIEAGKTTSLIRNLGDFDILIREPKLAEIVRKIMEQTGKAKKVDTMISGDTPFGIPTNPLTSNKKNFKISNKQDETHDVELLYLNKFVRTIAYISKDSINKNAADIYKYKVFVPKASGTGNDPYVIGKPELGSNKSVCSQTFLYAAFDSKLEAENFISYLKTKFFRALVSASKISQETPSKVYRFVPVQDFSQSWTDKELYEKYALTEEEIEFIEANIKPIE